MTRIELYLADVNVWLALAFEIHAHHKAAVKWFDGAAPHTAAFCRLTQQGFLRLASNAAVFGSEALSLDAAWGAYDAMLSDERVFFLTDPADVESHWRDLTEGCGYSHRVWSDAYLAAVAQAAEVELVSFDGGFSGYASRGVRVTVLGGPAPYNIVDK